MPYIESLGDSWGELCASPKLASSWADSLKETVELVWRHDGGHGYFHGTMACFSALVAAGRYEDVLALLAKAPMDWWPYRRWGVKALHGLGRTAEALAYASAGNDLTTSGGDSSVQRRPDSENRRNDNDLGS